MERIREERDSLLRRWKNLQSRNDCKDNLEERKRNRWLICQRRGLLPTDLIRGKRRRNRSLVVVTATLRWAMHCGFPFPSTSVSLEVSLLFYWGDFVDLLWSPDSRPWIRHTLFLPHNLDWLSSSTRRCSVKSSLLITNNLSPNFIVIKIYWQFRPLL